MSRRVTGSEEIELRRATRRLDAAERAAAKRHAERDRLIADIAAAGGRISDIAAILSLSRAAVYDAMTRARERE